MCRSMAAFYRIKSKIIKTADLKFKQILYNKIISSQQTSLGRTTAAIKTQGASFLEENADSNAKIIGKKDRQSV